MITELNTSQRHQQVSRWHQRAEQMHRLTHNGGPGHFGGRDAVVAGSFCQYRQYTVVKRVVGHEEGKGHAHQRGDHSQVGPKLRRNNGQQTFRHGIHHARARQDAGKNTGGEDQPHHRQHTARMGSNTVFLLLQARVVHDHGNAERDHEQHRQWQQPANQGNHQRQRQCAVEPDQFRATGIGVLRHADFAVVDVITLQVQLTQTRSFAQAIAPGDGQNGDATCQHGRNHGHEDIRRVDMQGAGSASSRATPRRHVHYTASQNDQPRHDARAHADAAVQRQHGGHANHVRGCTVAVQRHHQRQHGGTDCNLQRVAFNQFEDFAHGRIKQARVDHQGEVEDGKHQHHARWGEFGDAFEHHRADFWRETTEHRKQDRHQNQGNQCR